MYSVFSETAQANRQWLYDELKAALTEQLVALFMFDLPCLVFSQPHERSGGSIAFGGVPPLRCLLQSTRCFFDWRITGI